MNTLHAYLNVGDSVLHKQLSMLSTVERIVLESIFFFTSYLTHCSSIGFNTLCYKSIRFCLPGNTL